MRRKRNSIRKNRGQLNIEPLEARHVLASVMAIDQVGFQVAEDSGEQTIRLVRQNVALLGDAEFGSIDQDTNGAIRYTPADEFLGVDSFQFTYTLASGETLTDTAYIHVTESIYALPDWMQMAPSTDSMVLDVLANDYRIRGLNADDVTIISFTETVNGSLTLSEDGKQLIYEPNAGHTGTDEFTYTTRDTFGNESTATATIDVTEKAGTGQFSNLEHFYIDALSDRVRNLRLSFGAPTRATDRLILSDPITNNVGGLASFDGDANVFFVDDDA